MSEVKVNKISPRSGTGVTLGDSGDKFTVPSGSNITINSGASIVNDGTATGFDTDTNDKVKVSTNDTTPGFLNGKLVAGTNITLTEGSDGGNETLTAALSGTIPTARLGSGTASSSTFLRGDQTYASATPAAGSITTAQLAYNPNAFRNIIINGDMNVSQRATSRSSITADGYYTVDRFLTEMAAFGAWTQSQYADAPSGQGLNNSLKMDCTTAQGSLASNTVALLGQSVEGRNLQAINQGTSSAKSTTLSFWHKHTKTGTNIVELLDADNGNAVSGAYTQSNSNTWEKATIVYPANTSGTYGNDSNRSLRIRFIMGAGSDTTSGTLATTWQTSITNANRYVGQVNNADSTSNNFIITGVQYEVATVASEFELLPFDINLQRCHRYYYLIASGSGVNINFIIYNTATNTASRVQLSTIMRANPSLDITTGTGYYRAYRGGNSDDISAFTLDSSRTNYIYFYDSSTSSGTIGYGGILNTNNSSSYIAASAEL